MTNHHLSLPLLDPDLDLDQVSWDVIQELNQSYQPLAVKTSQGIVMVDGDHHYRYSYHVYSAMLPQNVKIFKIQLCNYKLKHGTVVRS